jgi:hypothetical protein
MNTCTVQFIQNTCRGGIARKNYKNFFRGYIDNLFNFPPAIEFSICGRASSMIATYKNYTMFYHLLPIFRGTQPATPVKIKFLLPAIHPFYNNFAFSA